MTAEHAFDTPDYQATSAQLAAAAEPPNPLFFNPDGTFKSPELAAFHAIHVQGGTTTPAREARRMIAEASRGSQTGATIKQSLMAMAWLAERGLTVEGEEEPAVEPHPEVLATVVSDLKVQFAQPAPVTPAEAAVPSPEFERAAAARIAEQILEQRPVTPAEAATARVLDDLPAPPVVVDLDQLADPAPLAWYSAVAEIDKQIAALREQIAPLQEQRDRAEEIIQDAMGDATEAKVGGRTVVTWRRSKPTQRLDRKALEAAYGEDVIARFLVDNKAARPFKIVTKGRAR